MHRYDDRPVVYIAHALSGERSVNLAKAKRWFQSAITAGYAPTAPYLMLPDVLPGQDDSDTNAEISIALVRHADELWLCGDVVSSGMQTAIKAARSAQIPVLRLFSLDDIQVVTGIEWDEEEDESVD